MPTADFNLDISNRDKRIVCGLFLSKFDQLALEFLGFSAFAEAFNVLGFSLDAPPAAIKNYRDEFDPYFPNPRQGWHRRPLRPHCRRILDLFSGLSLSELGNVVAQLISPEFLATQDPEIHDLISPPDEDSSFARRLITGEAAEEYFRVSYASIAEFQGFSLTDARRWGCGYDFRLTTNSENPYLAVEVKGMRTRTGQVQFTSREYSVAERLNDRFYLFVVRNFSETPFHTIIRNPVRQGITFTRVERQEIHVSWTANIS